MKKSYLGLMSYTIAVVLLLAGGCTKTNISNPVAPQTGTYSAQTSGSLTWSNSSYSVTATYQDSGYIINLVCRNLSTAKMIYATTKTTKLSYYTNVFPKNTAAIQQDLTCASLPGVVLNIGITDGQIVYIIQKTTNEKYFCYYIDSSYYSSNGPGTYIHKYTTNLVSKTYLKLNGNLADAIENQNYGISEGIKYNDYGKYGQAAQFDGASSLYFPNYPSFNNMDSFTLAAWVSLDTYSSQNRTIISKTEQNRDFVLYIDSSRHLVAELATSGSTYEICRSPGVVDWEWTHVAAQFTRDKQWKLYINGNLVATKACTYAPVWTGSTVAVGRMARFWYFKGRIDEVVVAQGEYDPKYLMQNR